MARSKYMMPIFYLEMNIVNKNCSLKAEIIYGLPYIATTILGQQKKTFLPNGKKLAIFLVMVNLLLLNS